jgi:hypothetical protein
VLGATDISDALKPGVYVLSAYGRVMYIGRSTCMLTTINDHRTASGQARLPEWFPVKGIRFNEVTIYPMPYSETDNFMQTLRERHKLHNKPVPIKSDQPTIARRL